MGRTLLRNLHVSSIISERGLHLQKSQQNLAAGVEFLVEYRAVTGT